MPDRSGHDPEKLRDPPDSSPGFGAFEKLNDDKVDGVIKYMVGDTIDAEGNNVKEILVLRDSGGGAGAAYDNRSSEDKTLSALDNLMMGTKYTEGLGQYVSLKMANDEEKAVVAEELGLAWDDETDHLVSLESNEDVDDDFMTQVMEDLAAKQEEELDDTAEQFYYDEEDDAEATDDPDAEATEDELGSAYPDHEKVLQEFLEGKSLAYAEEKAPNYPTGPIEQISMSYQGQENEPGLADITASMREQLGYSEGRNDPDALDEHTDAILEAVLGNKYRNDSCFSRHDRALADISRTAENSMRTPDQLDGQLAYAITFERQSQANYERLRNDVKNELLNGQPSAEESFIKYQDDVNNAAKFAASSYANAGNVAGNSYTGDHYQILGVNPDATDSEIRRSYRAAAKEYHSDHHPYPEYGTYMAEVNAAYDALSDPNQRATYDQLLINNAQAHEEWRQAHPSDAQAQDAWRQEHAENNEENEQNEEYEDLEVHTGFGDKDGSDTGDPTGTHVMGYDENNQNSTYAENNQNGGSDTSVASYEPPDPQETGTQDPPEDENTNWTPEKVANWHKENEEKGLSWLELILLIIASMIANANEKATGFSAQGVNNLISTYIDEPRGPTMQEQHAQTVEDLGKIEEDVATKYAVNDPDDAEALRDLTMCASIHLREYGMYDDDGNQQRNGGEPYYDVVDYDEDDQKVIDKTYYKPIKGLEWDNKDRTLDATMQESMTGTDEESMANRQSLSDMLKERVDWIQQSNWYVDFNDPDNAGTPQEMLDQYNDNQVNLNERKAAIDTVLLWNAENNLGGMTIYLDKSMQENRELSQQEIQAIADTIRHCDYLINATGTQKQERTRS